MWSTIFFFETIISGDVLSRDAGTFAYVLLRTFTGGRWGSGIFTRVLVPQMICWTKYKRNFPAYHFVKRKTSTSVRHRIFEHFTTTLQQGSTKTSIFHVFPWSITIISSVQVLIIGGGDGGVLREVVKHSCVEKAFRGFDWYGRRGFVLTNFQGQDFPELFLPSKLGKWGKCRGKNTQVLGQLRCAVRWPGARLMVMLLMQPSNLCPVWQKQ